MLQTLVMKSHRKGGYLKAETKSARVPVQRSEQGLGGSGSRGGATASGCHHFCLPQEESKAQGTARKEHRSFGTLAL